MSSCTKLFTYVRILMEVLLLCLVKAVVSQENHEDNSSVGEVGVGDN